MPSPIDDYPPYATDRVAHTDTDTDTTAIVDLARLLGRPSSTRPTQRDLRMIAKVDHQRRIIVTAAAPAPL